MGFASNVIVTPQDALWDVMCSIHLVGSIRHRHSKPGELVGRMPERIRSKLRDLRSDDARLMRFEKWMLDERRAWDEEPATRDRIPSKLRGLPLRQ